MTELFSYRKLTVYQQSKKYVADIYRLLLKFPSDERFALAGQLRRAAIFNNVKHCRRYGKVF